MLKKKKTNKRVMTRREYEMEHEYDAYTNFCDYDRD